MIYVLLEFMQILYEDAYVLAVNKPAGLQVEKDRWGYPSLEGEVAQYLSSPKKQAFIGIVHRIDRPVSGVVLLAKKKSVLVKLHAQFREKQIQKTYYGIVRKKPDRGKARLVNWIKRDAKNKFAIVSNRKTAGAYYCELAYTFVHEQEGYYLLQIEPVTGKFHQIRAQMAAIGSPIVGDVLYGSADVYRQNEICLHAQSLQFMHPVQLDNRRIICDFPDTDLWRKFTLHR
jgi:23S rRNA pseudouridine1911/1915/1917 synthase